ncbi:Flavohemoprotein [Streptomyces ambofaciens ATCC 23877]|uniref:Flavohemoprotein n=1 Tax=Streptomyces ambofaciens (strain ATCC 23877 / 3486 / DSM 40053 / JCM 4204 / NBRC 12836 / NRRL B-2516) TaxID=278992 RepID=A3KJ00_STRA7|nr:globin domain-containing protein [Streptomyces ambofaciens]AKZ53826.1 Flavohemoprotein [Streptomyces ambofaciens ATCC 23877]CAJ89684.1 putative flavohemoprotein [Streptomyces ambofaciens ATCC 23877]
MLSEQSVPVVRATLPAVGGALGDITTLFYRKLFDAHPELLRDLFNRGNQAGGEQQRALAGSIAGFAGMLLDHPDVRPDAMLSRIAHKHASLGITAEQYKIVHRHLFAAIAEVLGDAVTPEVAAAWDEVYWLMAHALMALETRLYQEAGVAEGEVWRRMEIVERREQTPDAVSLALRPVDGHPTPPFRPGQYVSVRSELPDGSRQIRQYSLSAGPGRSDRRITVKRVRGGAGPEGEVSSWLHAHAREGDVLTVSAPFGDLAPVDGDGPLLLASAGIGITPVLSVLDHLAASGATRPVTVVHADRTPADHAHRQEQLDLIRALPGARLHLWYEEPGDQAPHASAGRADLAGVDLPPGLTAYLCGPVPFMRAVRGDLLRRGVPARAVHYEVFGPDLWLGRP